VGRTAKRGTIVLAALVVATATLATSSSVSGDGGDPDDFSAGSLSPDTTESAAKSVTGRLAQSDASLLGRSDATLVNVVVKLDYDATASYAGDIAGLPATSPSVTGVDLTGDTAAEQVYEDYTSGIDEAFRAELAAAIPSATAGDSLQRVYGGVAVSLPANKVGQLLELTDVAAVQSDEPEQLQTDSSTEFIGAPTIWDQTGGQALAGQGVIFGDLDSGVWPEHPSFENNAGLGAPPPKADGTPRVCDFGDNPLTPATDVFACNNKLIGGQPFLDTYNVVFGGEIFPDSARDSNGHGTHTTSTAAGSIVDSAPIFGIERGPISGVAPGAWVIEYKVCGLEGCFPSDSAAAVAQAILDGVDVINFSISGGANPFSDVVELAFLDAYEAGILVAASAGNAGPGPDTTDHHGPWTLTVAASTQTRAFQSTLTVTDGVDTATFEGATITPGVPTSTPIVLAQNIPGNTGGALCTQPLPAGSATGMLVACLRGPGRVLKGFNVMQGGAVGMILYNVPLAEALTDNHFIPTVHLYDGTDFLAFLAAHPGATGSFTEGVKGEGQGDVITAFSSRGPGGQFLKPDITAPGAQILAGNTPIREDVAGGPPGELFQAIAGTSMSSPHAAGSAILLKALHPDWSPGAIKSALMTTAITDVVKEDLVTPADPFDFGAGRVDLNNAGDAPIVFDESALRMLTLGNNPITALDVNIPSINAPTMPGTVTLVRTATNVSGQDYNFDVTTEAPAGATIKVSPKQGRIRAGESRSFEVTITSSAPSGQYFGEITFTSRNSSQPAVHLPVAFFNEQGDVTLSQSCDPASIPQSSSTTCTVSVFNDSFDDATVNLLSTVSSGLRITGATGATVSPNGKSASVGPELVEGERDATPAIAPATDTPGGGYLDLELFGIGPVPVGDESIVNFNVPAYVYGGVTYTRIGITSNGYAVVGGGVASDVDFIPQTLPDPVRPNGVLAPYWTDLDGTGTEGIRAATLTDGVSTWLVLQWDVRLWGITTPDGARAMQIWIGIDGTEDISYEYAASALGQTTPPGYGLTVGAENPSGTGGAQIVGPPTSSYRITTTPGAPGETLTYTLTILGVDRGPRSLTTSMTASTVAGTTTVSTPIVVTKK